MKKGISDEWKKVEGRFKPTSINIKYDQCLSLIGHIFPKTGQWKNFKAKFDKELNNLYNQAWDFKGFMLPPESEGENPFENGYPLHPITLFALDRLSKKVAQNERTFFTYLAGDEDNSLFSQLMKYDLEEFHFIGLDAIYDYFELNIKAFKTDESYGIYKKLQYALSKLGLDGEGYQTKILKAIAAINIISDVEKLCGIIERWNLTKWDVKNSGSSDAVVKSYRVRKAWKDAGSQLGAYTVLDNAKAMADKHEGYTVYDWNGKAVYGAEVTGGSGLAAEFSNADCPFLVKVSIDDLNIRKGAGTNTAKTGMYTGVGVFTILEVKIGKGSDAGWGRLKSGAGWISLDYCQRV